MIGKTVLITGANSGIGFETARQLARLGAEVLMVSRDPGRGLAARNEIVREAAGPLPALFIADLASQASIRALAEEVQAWFPRIDVLINNAGAIFARRELSVDGIEMTFAVNHLAPFLLTHLLFGPVQAAPHGRVITVASEIHSGTLDFDNLQGERHYNFLKAYNTSKLENILFSYELSRRVETTGVTVNSLSPGPTATHFGDNLTGLPSLFPQVMKRIPFLFVDPKKGAATSVYLAASDEVAGLTGRFFFKRRETRTKPISYNLDVARRLWDLSEMLVKNTIDDRGVMSELMSLEKTMEQPLP